MLLTYIVNNFFPAYKDARFFQKEFLLNVQNTYALVMLSYLMRQLYNCSCYDQCTSLMAFYTKFNYYFVLDIVLCDHTLYLHHALSFIILYIYTANFEIIQIAYSAGIAFAMIEISTTFLTIRAILKKYKRAHPYITMIYNINDAIFVITFFYTRIYLYYKQVLQNQELYNITRQFTLVEYHYFNICLYLLYCLNLYWAYQILQIFVKPLFARVTITA
jgi:hypothetical protein